MRWALAVAWFTVAACGPSEFFGEPDASGGDDASPEPDAAAVPDASPGTPDAAPVPDSGTAALSHTIVIDGANDFSPDERLATSSASFDAFVTWDAQFVYVGMSGPDVASADNRRFLLIYIGGNNGTTNGEIYNTQQPVLPFAARYHVRWKADNTFTSAMQFDGVDWVETGIDFTGSVFQSGEFVELRLARADMEMADFADLHISMINEADMAEGTFAGTPALSFADGYDPDYTSYYEFDLAGTVAPGSHTPL